MSDLSTHDKQTAHYAWKKGKCFRALPLMESTSSRMAHGQRYAAALVHPISGEKVYWVGDYRSNEFEAEEDADLFHRAHKEASRMDQQWAESQRKT
jgi:hypothetical protein